ncbi:hypothetical protein ACHAXS_008261 [Conticribra weissflogii]
MDAADGWESLLGYLANSGAGSSSGTNNGSGNPSDPHGVGGLGAPSPYAAYGAAGGNYYSLAPGVGGSSYGGGNGASSAAPTASGGPAGAGAAGFGYGGGYPPYGGYSGSTGYSLSMPAYANYSTAANSSAATGGASSGGGVVTASRRGGGGRSSASPAPNFGSSGSMHGNKSKHKHKFEAASASASHGGYSGSGADGNRRSSGGDSEDNHSVGAALADYASYYHSTGGNRNGGWGSGPAADPNASAIQKGNNGASATTKQATHSTLTSAVGQSHGDKDHVVNGNNFGDFDFGDLFLRCMESMGDNHSLSMWLMNNMQQQRQQQQMYHHAQAQHQQQNYGGLNYSNSIYGDVSGISGTSSNPLRQRLSSPNSIKSVSSAYNLPSSTADTTSGASYALDKKSHHSSLYKSSVTTTLSASSNISPTNCSDHASRPATQIDPLLEKLTLAIPAVSLEPLSGSEVLRHIRTKTDDVITRFLPCVEFLVNCQQELRQGLQIANRRRITNHGNRSRSTVNMTPRQFFLTYVAPLPQRFEKTNEIIMAKTHLQDAKKNLDQLVKDASDAVPQGCEQVKNAFLGGMRENESWGLRKWLSKHGGAGSICNDLEEIMRVVKSLKREEETTIRMAEMVRPIAGQAHERLKKDVPQAYQEQSSAHPYLPFFHRLEACLKQLATFNPEEDDVICLDDSDDDDDDDVNVIETVSSATCAVHSSPVKKSKSSPSKGSSISTRSKRSNSKREEGAHDTATSIWDEMRVHNERMKRSKQDTNSSTSGDDTLANFYFGDSSSNNKNTNTRAADDDDDDSEIEVLEIDGDGNFAPIPATGHAPQATAAEAAAIASAQGHSRTSSIDASGKWRCPNCSFLNEEFASKCTMCFDDDSTGAELAKFLRGSEFDGSADFGETSNLSFGQGYESLRDDGGDQSWKALRATDSRELESLADHISEGKSLPKEAHKNVDEFWGATSTFPQLLRLFRNIILHPASQRFLEPVNENHLMIMGLPPFNSVVRHPLCFHAIVTALSKSEDSLKCHHLVMRLSNGQLNIVGLQHWNMWNGTHLIEAIDLVFLNALAYNGNEESQEKVETEELRKMLWDGVNSMLKSLKPHERREHLPQKRMPTNSFVSR